MGKIVQFLKGPDKQYKFRKVIAALLIGQVSSLSVRMI